MALTLSISAAQMASWRSSRSAGILVLHERHDPQEVFPVPSDMTMTEALVVLHGACHRQGPGDDAITARVLSRLPDLPPSPRIADLGCGTGASAFVLAETLDDPVVCVDFMPQFIAILNERAKTRGLDHLIRSIVGDMAEFRHPEGPLDLLWSEGAAYNLTFAGALKAWRPMLKAGGLAVISELSWFGTPSDEAAAFWAEAYPQLSDEATNVRAAQANGFEVLFIERLPAEAWRHGYYAPLANRADELEIGASETLSSVIDETRREIALFDRWGGSYGYTFYALKAA